MESLNTPESFTTEISKLREVQHRCKELLALPQTSSEKFMIQLGLEDNFKEELFLLHGNIQDDVCGEHISE